MPSIFHFRCIQCTRFRYCRLYRIESCIPSFRSMKKQRRCGASTSNRSMMITNGSFHIKSTSCFVAIIVIAFFSVLQCVRCFGNTFLRISRPLSTLLCAVWVLFVPSDVSTQLYVMLLTKKRKIWRENTSVAFFIFVDGKEKQLTENLFAFVRVGYYIKEKQTF